MLLDLNAPGPEQRLVGQEGTLPTRSAGRNRVRGILNKCIFISIKLVNFTVRPDVHFFPRFFQVTVVDIVT